MGWCGWVASSYLQIWTHTQLSSKQFALTFRSTSTSSRISSSSSWWAINRVYTAPSTQLGTYLCHFHDFNGSQLASLHMTTLKMDHITTSDSHTEYQCKLHVYDSSTSTTGICGSQDHSQHQSICTARLSMLGHLTHLIMDMLRKELFYW